jgi:hypothetical protein
MLKQIAGGISVLSFSAFAAATDLTIHLNGSQPISRNTIQYQCDAQGAKMGLPGGRFSFGGNEVAPD